jgi:hypothetical protein
VNTEVDVVVVKENWNILVPGTDLEPMISIKIQ